MSKLIPNRKAESNRGRRPTIHTKELGGPRKRVARQEDNEVENEDNHGEEEKPHIGKCLDEAKVEDEEETSKWHPFYRKYT